MQEDKLVNKGWAQMSDLLDEQMPTDRDRKGLFIWWFFGGVLLLSIPFSIWYFATDDNGNQSNLNQVQIASNSEQNENPISESSTELLEVENDQLESSESYLNSEDQESFASKEKENSKVNSQIVAISSSKRNDDKLFESNNVTAIEPNEITSQNNGIVKNTEENSVNLPEDPATKSNIEISKSRNIQITELLSSLETEIIPYSNEQQVNFDLEPTNQWNFKGFLYGNGVSLGQYGVGLNGGVAFAVNKEFSNWSLITGMDYNYYNRATEAFSISADDLEVINGNTGSVNEDYFSEEEYRQSIQQLYSIGIPIMMEYRRKRFLFGVGLKNEFRFLNIWESIIRKSENNTLAGNINRNSYHLYSMVTVGIHLTNRITVNGSYLYRASDLLNVNQSEALDGPNQFQLGMRYYFKK